MSTVMSLSKIQEHMEVVCSHGMHVGTVDHVEGDRIKLTRNGSTDGQHHVIPTSIVARVDDKVHLSKSGSEVESIWQTA
jgi:hypothetical protein